MNLVEEFEAFCDAMSSRGAASPSGIVCRPIEDVIMPATISFSPVAF